MADQKFQTKIVIMAGGIIGCMGLYLIATSAFYPLKSVSGFDAKRILQVGLIAFSVVFAMCWPPLRTQSLFQLSRMSKHSRIILATFFSIGIISSLQLAHSIYALIDVSMLFLLACMIVVTAASRDLAPDSFDKLAVVSIAVLGLAVFVQEFMGYLVGWVTGNEFSYKEALMHFAHPRFYNQLQTWFLPIIALIPLVFPKKRRLNLLCLLLLGFQWFLIISLAARGTTISLIFAAIFVAVWLPKARQYWLKIHLQGLVVGAIVYLGFLFLNSLLIAKSESGAFYANSVGRSMIHTSGRTGFWELSISEAINSPWLGNGPAHYACDHMLWIAAHPHSFPLQILGEWGFPATILLLAFGLLIGLKYLNSLRSNTNENSTELATKAIVAISLIAGLTHACVSGLLIMPASQVAFVLIVAWALSLSNQQRNHNGMATRLSPILIFSSAVALTLFAVALNELRQLPERTSYTEELGAMNPRFWQDGKVCEYNYERVGSK